VSFLRSRISAHPVADGIQRVLPSGNSRGRGDAIGNAAATGRNLTPGWVMRSMRLQLTQSIHVEYRLQVRCIEGALKPRLDGAHVCGNNALPNRVG
jgi:hypothetical protein